ncbi:DUF3830 family protein [Saxibacter everestensis]|uniref:DUF3830 family protein n=1 Tax=Saxibacter everestensis TaxID=2909229 RepID=A0ABY8QU46_9MICO|nr:DUF3830 family protein [Brevibacteriaceae bacterium ZFBP1038]
MPRFIKVTLESRGVSCIARLLDDEAPRTASAVWNALPLSSQVFHGKYARNEIYNFIPAFAEVEPGKENTTITPIPGDLCYFAFDADDLGNPGYGYGEGEEGFGPSDKIIDLALFYGRNNLLINGDQGWVPGNVFGAVVEGMEEMAAACQDIWMGGARGETLSFSRVEDTPQA